MNCIKIFQYYQRFRKQIIMYLALIWVVFFFTTYYIEGKKYVDDDQTLAIVLQHIDELHRTNMELIAMKNNLNQKLIFSEKKMMDKWKIIHGPSEGYEVLRRRIYSNTKEFWYYIRFSLQSLANEFKDLEPTISHMKIMVDEHYRSLLRDVAKLADVDGYSQWRWKEFDSLSKLVEKRIQHTQNPPDCAKAKKLQCNFVNVCSHRTCCGYGCRVHHFVKCLVVAYATERTMIIGTPKKWEFTSKGFENIFLPLSDTCASNDGETISLWPGNETIQVINYNLPESAAKHLNPPYIPVVLPEDLAKRINVLHGDPAVWWIGQFFKYIFRLQPSTTKVFDEFSKRVHFKKPIVGVHIRRSDKLLAEASFHKLEEYMYHVEEYYKLKELNGEYYTKRIYLATDDATLFNEARLKYPEYDIIGDRQISKTAGILSKRELDSSIMNIITDIYFLSHHCDYLVCTFSSNVCRLAYEIMNSLQPDASAKFTSLDDTFYFSGQVHRLNVALISHKADGPDEMDLEVGDEIEVAGNHWDGYSKGTNLRTKKTLLYPSFKVTTKIEVLPFATYPNITVDI